MEMNYVQILGDVSSFKVCKKCNRINWYENEECIECGGTEFYKGEKRILKVIDEDVEFYMNEEGYEQEEALENVWVEV